MRSHRKSPERVGQRHAQRQALAALLAFARRQPLDPKVVAVERFIRDMEHMLRKATGEGVTIEW